MQMDEAHAHTFRLAKVLLRAELDHRRFVAGHRPLSFTEWAEALREVADQFEALGDGVRPRLM